MADEIELSVVVKSHDFSCSGMILNVKTGTVLTVGSIFNGFFEQNLVRYGKTGFNFNQNFKKFPKLQVIVKVTSKSENLIAPKDTFLTYEGTLKALWRDPCLYTLQNKFFPEAEWKFGNEKDENENGKSKKLKNRNKNERLSLNFSEFALIEVRELKKYSVKEMTIADRSLQLGDWLSVVGTPFGSECYSVFFNSFSKGIVSNIIGSQGHLILTDARCIPGSEGCPVFHDKKLFGIVVAPFCWRNGEWIGLTLVCSIQKILHHLMDVKNNINYLETTGFQAPHSLNTPIENVLVSNVSNQWDTCAKHNLTKAIKSVVLVQAGATWGSGIVMDARDGLVITCRHILTEGGIIDGKRHSIPLSVHDINNQTVYYDIEIVFATGSSCPLDFALLRIRNHSLKSDIIPRNIIDLETSHDVYAVGYSTFGYKTSNGPCVTMGTVSKVTYVKDKPIMLQTTAAVHGGGSGGAIVCRHTGELLGMVTCNVKDSNSSAAFPHVNFSIPVNLIQQLTALSTLNETEKNNELSKLVSCGVDRMWCLGASQPAQSKL